MRLSLAQLNPLIGDLKGNYAKIINTCTKANKNNADLVITPELSLLGYPPRGLLFNQHLVNRQWVFLDKISAYINSRERVQKLFKQAEFKRRQAPPVLKVSDQAFGSGWRKPIAST